MIEKILYLKGIDQASFYGHNNIHIEIIKSFFPKLKIIARGDQVKAIGNPDEIEVFEKKIERIINHLEKFNKMDQYSLEGILNDTSKKNLSKENDPDILLFGNSGKPIRSRTPNQKVMVERYNIDDLIVATGPAGSGKTYMAVALAVSALP